jgi:hypothetical protein
VLLTSEVVYFVTYSSGLTVGTVLGLAIAVTRAPAAAEDAMPGVPDAASPPPKSPRWHAQPDLRPINGRSGMLKRTAPRKQGPA